MHEDQAPYQAPSGMDSYGAVCCAMTRRGTGSGSRRKKAPAPAWTVTDNSPRISSHLLEE
jgi:hypothetical protein